MTTKKAVEEEKEDATGGGTDESKDGDKGDGGSAADNGSLEGRIRELVREALDGLLGDHGKGAGSNTRVDDEEALFQRVKKAQEKIKAEEEKEGKIVQLEETLKKIVEKPPARDGIGGKVSRFLWGSED